MIRNREDSAAILNNTAVVGQTITGIHAELVRTCLEEALAQQRTARASEAEIERLILRLIYT